MAIDHAVCLFETDLEGPVADQFASGRAVWYSHRSPEKDTENEDSLALLPIDQQAGILAIADGLGGHINGAAASRLAIETLRKELQQNQSMELRSVILDTLEKANRALKQQHPGAATTLAVVELHENHMRAYHVGDSVILLTGQRGKRKLITTAHSPVGYAVEAGLLDEDEAIHHDERHLVSNVVGSDHMTIEVGANIKLAAKDTLLLASDGLFDNLYLEEIIDTIRTGDLLQCGQQLEQLAHQRMLQKHADHPSHADDLSFILYRPG